jgi:hypothetical protein
MRSFEADEKIFTRNCSSECCGYFVFIDIPAYRLQNYFLERPKPHVSINLRHSAIIPLHGRGEQLVDPTFGFLALSIPSHV